MSEIVGFVGMSHAPYATMMPPESPDEPGGAFLADVDRVARAVSRIDPDVIIAIGPEGGFAPEELEGFGLCGFARIGMGPRILRTETAAIAALVMLQTRFGDMSSLRP